MSRLAWGFAGILHAVEKRSIVGLMRRGVSGAQSAYKQRFKRLLSVVSLVKVQCWGRIRVIIVGAWHSSTRYLAQDSRDQFQASR
jgi:hypothetical protein